MDLEQWDKKISDCTVPELARISQQARLGMERYGGSFMKSMGETMCYADSKNLRKILLTWNVDCLRLWQMAGNEDI